MRGWEKTFHANRKDMKAEVAILISDKIDFRTKAKTKYEEGYNIMVKGSIQEENIILLKYMNPIQEHLNI